MKLDKALSLLEDKFHGLIVKGNCAFSDIVFVCYRYSKSYNGKQIWWTSEYPERIEHSDYIIIALENKGLLVIPSLVILDYWDRFNVSFLAHSLRNIRIKEVDGDVVLYNKSDQGYIKVTEYLN